MDALDVKSLEVPIRVDGKILCRNLPIEALDDGRQRLGLILPPGSEDAMELRYPRGVRRPQLQRCLAQRRPPEIHGAHRSAPLVTDRVQGGQPDHVPPADVRGIAPRSPGSHTRAHQRPQLSRPLPRSPRQERGHLGDESDEQRRQRLVIQVQHEPPQMLAGPGQAPDGGDEPTWSVLEQKPQTVTDEILPRGVRPPGDATGAGKELQELQPGGDLGRPVPAAGDRPFRDLADPQVLRQRPPQPRLQLLGQISLQVLRIDATQVDLQRLDAVVAIRRAQLGQAAIDQRLEPSPVDLTEAKLDLPRHLLTAGGDRQHLAPDTVFRLGQGALSLTVTSRTTIRVTGKPGSGVRTTCTSKVVSSPMGASSNVRSSPVPGRASPTGRPSRTT